MHKLIVAACFTLVFCSTGCTVVEVEHVAVQSSSLRDGGLFMNDVAREKLVDEFGEEQVQTKFWSTTGVWLLYVLDPVFLGTGCTIVAQQNGRVVSEVLSSREKDRKRYVDLYKKAKRDLKAAKEKNDEKEIEQNIFLIEFWREQVDSRQPAHPDLRVKLE